MRFNRILAAALFVAAAPLEAQVLTLEEARSLALDKQPALRALELSARATRQAALADGALPDPRLKFGALNFPTQGFPGAREDMTQAGLSWEQAFPGGDKRRRRTERTHAEAGLAEAERHGLRQSIERDVGVAWSEAWLSAGAERLAAQLSAEYGRAVELAGIGSGSGRGTSADVLAARQMLNQSVDRRLELAAQSARARAALARWLPGGASRPLPEQVPELPPPPPLGALAASLEGHPQHGLHLAGQELADAEVALAREGSKPDRSVEVGYFARAGGRSDMVMFQLAFELPVYGGRKQDSTLDAKLKLADRARELRTDHLRQLQADLQAAHADWTLAGERLRNLSAAIVPDARARLETLAAQHAAGTAPLAAVFEARRALLEARIQELGQAAARLRARIALQYFERGDHR
jgi:cobalt-zinc-cadmium efflux system outer membrane protein